MNDTAIHLWAPAFSGFGGGISAFSCELAKALAESSAELKLFGKNDVRGSWDGSPLRGAGRSPERLRTASFVSQVLFGAGIARPGRIICTHLNFGPAAHLARRHFGIPYVLVAHGVEVDSSLSAKRLAALGAAEQVVAVSEWTRQRLLTLGVTPHERIAVLPNTYDDCRFSPGEAPVGLRQRYGIGEGQKVILTVARLVQSEGYKGYDRILEALPAVRAACGAVRYLIAGKGDDRARLEAIARKLGVTEMVTFAGFVPDEELADHYRLADVFAMPSTGEGFGIVFLESMGCGTPVLGGNQDGSVDALDRGRLGKLVDPGSLESIGAGLIDLLQQQGPELWFGRDQLSQAVKQLYGREAFRRRVAERFPLS
jgi:phosphatidyl-myo-inositol dimannoside synthase